MNLPLKIEGWLKIFNPETQEIFCDQKNAIHYENMSQALAQSIANKNIGYIYENCSQHERTGVSERTIETRVQERNRKRIETEKERKKKQQPCIIII